MSHNFGIPDPGRLWRPRAPLVELDGLRESPPYQPNPIVRMALLALALFIGWSIAAATGALPW